MDICMQCPTAGVMGRKKLTAKQSYDLLNNQEIKVIIVGDGYTGKTALIEQFIKQEFSWKYNATVSFDMWLYAIDIQLAIKMK